MAGAESLRPARQLLQGRKKRLNAALDKLAESEKGESSDETIVEFFLAQQINQASGGPVVAPWEVKLLPERYPLVATGLMNLKGRRQKLMKARAQLEKVFSDWRSQHPTYQRKR